MCLNKEDLNRLTETTKSNATLITNEVTIILQNAGLKFLSN